MDSSYHGLPYNVDTVYTSEIQLIYRGESFPYFPPAPKPYKTPRAINWRYRVPGETYSETEAPTALSYRKLRAVNWRYQSARASC